MADKIQSPASGAGQPGAAPSGTPATDPNAQTGGQAADGTDKTSGNALIPGQDVEVFFDPKELDAALQGVPEPVANQIRGLEKQLRGVFSKKTESIAKERQKVEAYNAFMADPVSQIQRLAAQYGFQVSKPGQREPGGGADPAGGTWEPKTWDEVFEKFQSQIIQRLQGDLKPVFDNVQKITASNIEQQLDKIDPDWKMYEDDMKANLQAHPSLVNDVAKLYRISVPDEVLNSRAVQQALKKVQNQVDASKVHGGHGTSRSEPAPKKASSFNEAVQIAREKGKKEGWYR